jgi:hypothetical protein
LKPFYTATIMLQNQSYQSLSTSKIIENSFINFFEKKSSDTNPNENEKLLSRVIFQSIEKHLVTKISTQQKNVTLVKIL